MADIWGIMVHSLPTFVTKVTRNVAFGEMSETTTNYVDVP